MGEQVEPFRIEVPQSQLDDLRERLARTRWPEPETVDDWSQGTPLAYVQEVCEYWANEYDWRRCEAALNALPQVWTEIDGLGIHAIHVRSKEEYAMPLVLTHGWPGSIIEFLDVIGPLTDPAAYGGDPVDAFHVVCPSLPGFGFSDKPSQPGWNVERIADAWDVLMGRLGYDRYGAQGGDWGSSVTTRLALRHRDRVAGIHLNMVVALPPKGQTEFTPREQEALAGMQRYQDVDSGYSKQQSTRPQTIGYGLVDSPAAQAAWVLEKFWAWTDCDGHPENALTRDQLLDNLMMYWLPGAGASSARLYWESFRSFVAEPIDVPTGVAIFPKEIFRPTREWAERQYRNIWQWNELDRGGHFAAFEQPELFVEEVRSFFRRLR